MVREKINFDKDWFFHRGEIQINEPLTKGYMYISAKTERAHMGPASQHYYLHTDSFEEVEHKSELWTKIDLPSDYVINGVPSNEYNNALGFLKYDSAWYVKKFNLDASDKEKRLTLLFEGVASQCVIYLNGCLLKRNFSGYNTFEVDITDVAKFDSENTLSVHISTSDHEGWWYEGGGIYRHVFLVKTAPVSVDLWGIYAKPVLIDNENWIVKTQLTIRNDDYENKEITIVCRILDACNNTVAVMKTKGEITKRTIKEFNLNLDVFGPNRWSPEFPYQYTMQTEIYCAKQQMDVQSVKFGFRTYKIDPDKGLFINDKHYKIKGVCGHADCGLFGKAVPDNIHRYKVKLLKEMGANGYRATHYMQSEALMDALDENGFIVMNETRWFESSDDGKQQLTTLVKRDRNRPSVFFWSIGNEEPHHTTEEGRRICKSLIDICKKLDDSRTIMTAVCHDPDIATVYDELEAIGINYNWNKYDAVRKKYPNKAIFSSENCATGSTRGWYFAQDDNKGYLPAYDRDMNNFFRGREFTWKFIAEREWLFGGYQWIAFEHRGEARWPRVCSQSGAIDLFMQKKDAFYQNQSHWFEPDERPILHLLPHWNFDGFEGEEIRVVAYTNLPKVELFLNGKSVGNREVERYGHAEWKVPYEAGKIEVFGYDQNGKIISSQQRITSKKPARLALSLDTKELTANGADFAIFSCYVLDEDGIVVPDASPLVSFTAEGIGTVYSTGSDISEHKSIFESKRKMRAGRIGVAVKISDKKGELKLIATADGLTAAVFKTQLN